MKEYEDHASEEPDFDDPSHDELRALLASAAAPATMPADVAARLDATLADLVAGSAAEEIARVVPLRRRWGGQRLLVAAAAVVLLGAGAVGVTRIIDSTRQADSFASSTAQSDAAAEAPLAEPAPGATGSLPGSGANLLRNDYSAAQRLAGTEFTEAGFAQQVSHFVDTVSRSSAYDVGAPALPSTPAPQSTTKDDAKTPLGAEAGSGTGSAPEQAPATGSGPWADQFDRNLSGLVAANKAGTCAGPAVPAGAVSLPITFEGRPAALVLHPATDGTRYAAAWSCDGHRLLAYATIPA